jgi:serine protease Do
MKDSGAMKRQLFLLLGLTAVVAFVLGLVAAGSRPAGDPRSAVAAPARAGTAPLSLSVASALSEPRSGESKGEPKGESSGLDFSLVAAKLNAAVVNIDAATRGEDRPATQRQFRRNYRDDGSGPREGSGSGFVIDRAGYILTNHHVIEGADRVTVTLGDGRAMRATIVGTDPAIDIALLKIPATAGLQAAPLGNSDGLRVGEWVCAIGNPAGYVHSVTVGVVSFLGRKLSDPGLDSFIQTDAAITFGNSGGPLINSRGEVVGITTAISSEASNIGFAIPITQVIGVLGQMKEHGRVTRGYLAVRLTSATPDLRKSLRLGAPGALVEDVTADTPAERSGLRPYDVITAIDGNPVQTDDDVLRYVSAQSPGTVSTLSIWRNGAVQALRVKLTERPLPRTARPLTTSVRASTMVHPEQTALGLTVKDADAAGVSRLKLTDVAGVLVAEVDPAGAARLARVRAGHIVLEVNRRRVSTAAEFRAAIATLRPGDTAALFIYDRRTDQRALHSVVVDPQ